MELKLYAVDSEQGADFITDTDNDGNSICVVAAEYELKLKDNKWNKATQQILKVTIELESTKIILIVHLPNGTQYEMTIKNPKL